MKYILYNPLSGSGKGKNIIENLKNIYDDSEYYDVTQIENMVDFIGNLNSSDRIVLCGGDGTINHFVNDIKEMEIKNDVYYLPIGSGNDFAIDVGKKNITVPFKLNEYIKNLPVVYLKGDKYRFINGIGYGVDGWCCDRGNSKRKNHKKPINYTKEVIKGLICAYKPKNAVIEVDGEVYSYKKVWLASTMNGRFYGGGVMAAPMQDRLNKENTVSVLVAHDLSRVRCMSLLPKIIKGTHVKYKKYVDVLTGHNIKITFNRPNSVQIDGETVRNVLEYRVKTFSHDKTITEEERNVII